MRKIYYLIFLLVPLFVLGQTYPQLSHYVFNRNFYNPAFIGSGGWLCINSNHHRQYRNLNDPQPEKYYTASGLDVSNNLHNIAPITSGVGLQMPIGPNGDFGGIGINMIQDDLAFETNKYLQIGGSAGVNINSRSNLRVGIQFQSQSKELKNIFKPHQWPDPKIPVAFNPDKKGNIGMGIYWQSEIPMKSLKYYLGFSVQQWFTREFAYAGVSIQSAKHWFILAGAEKIDIFGYNGLNFKPSMMIKWASGPGGMVNPSIDVNALLFSSKHKVDVGLGLRSTFKVQPDAMVCMIGYSPNLNNLKNKRQHIRIGYGYDIPMQSIASAGTHEIQINYCVTVDPVYCIICKWIKCKRYIWRHPRDMKRPSFD